MFATHRSFFAIVAVIFVVQVIFVLGKLSEIQESDLDLDTPFQIASQQIVQPLGNLPSTPLNPNWSTRIAQADFE